VDDHHLDRELAGSGVRHFRPESGR
jgi:hypothetical protein